MAKGKFRAKVSPLSITGDRRALAECPPSEPAGLAKVKGEEGEQRCSSILFFHQPSLLRCTVGWCSFCAAGWEIEALGTYQSYSRKQKVLSPGAWPRSWECLYTSALNNKRKKKIEKPTVVRILNVRETPSWLTTELDRSLREPVSLLSHIRRAQLLPRWWN